MYTRLIILVSMTIFNYEIKQQLQQQQIQIQIQIKLSIKLYPDRKRQKKRLMLFLTFLQTQEKLQKSLQFRIIPFSSKSLLYTQYSVNIYCPFTYKKRNKQKKNFNHLRTRWKKFGKIANFPSIDCNWKAFDEFCKIIALIEKTLYYNGNTHTHRLTKANNNHKKINSGKSNKNSNKMKNYTENINKMC